ncbi:MAG: hypothetical protein CMF49_02605 [Legionellales bacterium]|nr:hypothetical protein [Legionellales bacterium]|tara:strand:- start:353 stop:622 length:270 start_codon:yes stop_codon:yes gene_type:complete
MTLREFIQSLSEITKDSFKYRKGYALDAIKFDHTANSYKVIIKKNLQRIALEKLPSEIIRHEEIYHFLSRKDLETVIRLDTWNKLNEAS